jgi:hypothetical protein
MWGVFATGNTRSQLHQSHDMWCEIKGDEMEFETFLLTLCDALAPDPMVSMPSSNALIEYRDHAFEDFLGNFLRLMDLPTAPVAAVRMAIVAFNHEFESTASREVAALSQPERASLLRSVVHQCTADDLQLVAISAWFASNIIACDVGCTGDFAPITDLLAQFARPDSELRTFGLFSILLEICELEILSADFRYLILETVLFFQSPNPFIKSKLFQILNCLLRFADIIELPLLPRVFEYLQSQTGDSETESDCFLTWRVLVKSIPHQSETIFACVANRIVAGLANPANEESIDCICLFLQAFCERAAVLDSFECFLSTLVPLLFNLAEQCDLSVADSIEATSVHLTAVFTLKRIFRAFPESVEQLGDYCHCFNRPVVCLVALYYWIFYEFSIDAVILNFLRDSLLDQFLRIRLLGSRCVAVFAERSPELFDGNLYELMWGLIHDNLPSILRSVHRVLAAMADRLGSATHIFGVLLEHLCYPHSYVSSSAHYTLQSIASSVDGTDFASLVLQTYSDAVREGRLDKQIEMAWLCQRFPVKLRDRFQPLAGLAIELLTTTLRHENVLVAIEALTPLAALVCYVDFDCHRFLLDVMGRFVNFLTVAFREEGVLEALAVSLFFFIQKWDLAEFLPPILRTFLDIFFETRHEACISAVADILEHCPELLDRHQIAPLIRLASELLADLSPAPLGDLLALVRAMMGGADEDGRSALLIFALEIIRVGAERLPSLEPAGGLLAAEALRDKAAFLARVRASPRESVAPGICRALPQRIRHPWHRGAHRPPGRTRESLWTCELAHPRSQPRMLTVRRCAAVWFGKGRDDAVGRGGFRFAAVDLSPFLLVFVVDSEGSLPRSELAQQKPTSASK